MSSRSYLALGFAMYGDVTVCCSYCCCMLLDPRISITRFQGNIAEDGLHVDGEARDPEGAECGEINKMTPVRLSHPTLSCSLVPCSCKQWLRVL